MLPGGRPAYFVLRPAQNIALRHFLPISILGPPENIRKPLGFLMFSGGPKREHWQEMGYNTLHPFKKKNLRSDKKRKILRELNFADGQNF